MSNTVVASSPPSSLRESRPRPAAWLVLAAFGAVYVIWGSTYLGIHIAIESIPPLLMAGSRFLLAGLVLYPVMRLRGAKRPRRVHWRNATIVGALLLLAGNGGVSWAEQSVPSNIAALIIAATPLWIILIDWLRPGGNRPHAVVFGGLALGFVGVALIVASKNQFGETFVDPIGAAVLMIASFCWAIGSVFSRHAEQSETALLNVAMQMICGGILLLVSGMGAGEIGHCDWGKITARSLYAFGYLTLFGSLIGFTAYVWLLQVSSPARVSTYAYVNPFIALILGRVFLNEALPKSALLAGFCILAAVMLISFRKHAPKVAAPE
ncbi:MAG: EamA family transporter [Verrucomicrobiota bacterium]